MEARGIIEFYNNKAQLKLFCVNHIYNYNLESLWWFRIFDKFKKDRQNMSFIPNASGGDLITLIPPIHEMKNFNFVERYGELYFNCLCKKCHEKTDATLSILSASRYRVVCRMVISAFNRFIGLYHDPETNMLSVEDIHFLINKILISDQDISKTLRGIPVSYTFILPKGTNFNKLVILY